MCVLAEVSALERWIWAAVEAEAVTEAVYVGFYYYFIFIFIIIILVFLFYDDSGGGGVTKFL